MSERIDQDPKTNRQNDNEATEVFHVPNLAQQGRSYTDTPLSEAVGVHFAATEEEAKNSNGKLFFPDKPSKHLFEDPDHAAARETVPDINDKKPSYIKYGIAAVAGAGVLGAALLGLNKFKNDNYDEPLLGSNTASSASTDTGNERYEQYPVKFSVEHASADQFLNRDPSYPHPYTRAEQMDYAGTKLNNDTDAAIGRMRDQLAELGFPNKFTDENLNTRQVPRATTVNTPQEIWDQVTVGMFQVWEAAQRGDIDEAKKLAAAAADPGSKEYTDLIELFSNQEGIIPDGVAWEEQPVITSGAYEDVVATPESPVITFNKTSTFDTNDRVQAVLRFEKGENPDSSRWVLVKTLDIS